MFSSGDKERIVIEVGAGLTKVLVGTSTGKKKRGGAGGESLLIKDTFSLRTPKGRLPETSTYSDMDKTYTPEFDRAALLKEISEKLRQKKIKADEVIITVGDRSVVSREMVLPLTIMVVDVNGLKLTNDAFGHSVGDALLKAVGRICKEVTRPGDIICRTGGDEFVILLPNSDRAQAKALKDRIVSVASKTHVESMHVSLAIGYSVMRHSEEHFDDLFAEADNNMYRNKLRYGKTVKKRTMERLVQKLNTKHPEVINHAKEVSHNAIKLAQVLGLEDNELENIRLAASYHDIGKVMVPKELLKKKVKLTDKEVSQVRKHAELGYQLLKEVNEYKHIAEVVLSHHEWWNGTGYPQNLKGYDIPRAARIIAVADAYETMTGKHSYRKPLSKEDAVKELQNFSGIQFDPDLVELFIQKVLNEK